MKILIAGATSFIARELIRQALIHPSVSTVVALSRREVPAEQKEAWKEGPHQKLKTIILKDWEGWSDLESNEGMREELKGIGGVIWLVAITPSKVKSLPWEEAVKITREYSVKGIEVLTNQPREQEKLRFLYLSGDKVRRDASDKGWFMADYGVLRAQTETRIAAYAEASNGKVEACMARSGLVMDPKRDGLGKWIGSAMLKLVIGVPRAGIEVMSAGLLEQLLGGFEKETLYTDDLVRTGEKVLSASGN